MYEGVWCRGEVSQTDNEEFDRAKIMIINPRKAMNNKLLNDQRRQALLIYCCTRKHTR